MRDLNLCYSNNISYVKDCFAGIVTAWKIEMIIIWAISYFINASICTLTSFILIFTSKIIIYGLIKHTKLKFVVLDLMTKSHNKIIDLISMTIHIKWLEELILDTFFCNSGLMLEEQYATESTKADRIMELESWLQFEKDKS